MYDLDTSTNFLIHLHLFFFFFFFFFTPTKNFPCPHPGLDVQEQSIIIVLFTSITYISALYLTYNVVKCYILCELQDISCKSIEYLNTSCVRSIPIEGKHVWASHITTQQKLPPPAYCHGPYLEVLVSHSSPNLGIYVICLEKKNYYCKERKKERSKF